MPASVDLGSVLSPNTFSLFIAPSESVLEALITLTSRHRGKILYLCGNYPVLLPGFSSQSEKLLIRRALTIYQVQSILQGAEEPLTFFEHDRSLYDDNAELLPCIGELCRCRAEDTGSIVLFSTRLDKWLTRIEPYAQRMVLIIENAPPKRPAAAGPVSTQKILDGI